MKKAVGSQEEKGTMGQIACIAPVQISDFQSKHLETRKADSNDPPFSFLQSNIDLFFEWGRRENHPPILIYCYLNETDIFAT